MQMSGTKIVITVELKIAVSTLCLSNGEITT